MLSVSFRIFECRMASSKTEAEKADSEVAVESLQEVELCTLQPPLVEEGTAAQFNVLEFPLRLVDVLSIDENENNAAGGPKACLPATALRWSELARASCGTSCEIREGTLYSFQDWEERRVLQSNSLTRLFPYRKSVSDVSPRINVHKDRKGATSKSLAPGITSLAPFLCLYDAVGGSVLSPAIQHGVLVTSMIALRWVLGQVILYASKRILSTTHAHNTGEIDDTASLSSSVLRDVAAGIFSLVQSRQREDGITPSLISSAPCSCNLFGETLQVEEQMEGPTDLPSTHLCEACSSAREQWCWKMAYFITADCQLKRRLYHAVQCKMQTKDLHVDNICSTSTPDGRDVCLYPSPAPVAHDREHDTAQLALELVRVRWTTSLVRALTDLYSCLCAPASLHASATAVSVYAVVESSPHVAPFTTPPDSSDDKGKKGERGQGIHAPLTTFSSPPISSFTASFASFFPFTPSGSLLRLEVMAPAYRSSSLRWAFPFASNFSSPFSSRPLRWRHRVATLVEMLLDWFARPAEESREEGSDLFREAIIAKGEGRVEEAIGLLQEAKTYYEKCISLAQEGLQCPRRHVGLLSRNAPRMISAWCVEFNKEEEAMKMEEGETSPMDHWLHSQEVLEVSRAQAVLRQRLDTTTELLWNVRWPRGGGNAVLRDALESGVEHCPSAGVVLQDGLERFWRRIDAPFEIHGKEKNSSFSGRWTALLHIPLLDAMEEQRGEAESGRHVDVNGGKHKWSCCGRWMGPSTPPPSHGSFYSSFSPAISHDRVLQHPAVQPAVAALAWRETPCASLFTPPSLSSLTAISQGQISIFTDQESGRKKDQTTPRTPDSLLTCPATHSTSLPTVPGAEDHLESVSYEDHAETAVQLWSALLPSPTALQLILYSLFRLLVVGVANIAQVILQLSSLSTVSPSTRQRKKSIPSISDLSHWATTAAEACEKAVEVLREHLLEAHRPPARDLHALLRFIRMQDACVQENGEDGKTTNGGKERDVDPHYTVPAPFSHSSGGELQDLCSRHPRTCKKKNCSFPLPPAFRCPEVIANDTSNRNGNSAFVRASTSRSSASYAELLWCYQMHVKLLLRARQLWSVVGDRSREKAVKSTLHDMYVGRWSKIRATFERDESSRKEKIMNTVWMCEKDADNREEDPFPFIQECFEQNEFWNCFPFADCLVARLTKSDWEDLDKSRRAYLP